MKQNFAILEVLDWIFTLFCLQLRKKKWTCRWLQIVDPNLSIFLAGPPGFFHNQRWHFITKEKSKESNAIYYYYHLNFLDFINKLWNTSFIRVEGVVETTEENDGAFDVRAFKILQGVTLSSLIGSAFDCQLVIPPSLYVTKRTTAFEPGERVLWDITKLR